MVDLYAERTSRVKPNCTSNVLYTQTSAVHHVYMAGTKEKKVVSRLKKPNYPRTFIKEWRQHRDKTQEQLAELVGNYLIEQGFKKPNKKKSAYTHASVGRIENGKMPYTQPVLEAIAFALQTTPASLLMRDPTKGDAMWSIWEQALPASREVIEEQAEIIVKRQRAG